MELLRLKEVMKEKEVSGVELADAVNVTTTTISNITKGNNFPKPDLLLNIANYLDVDIRELFNRTKITDVDSVLNGFVEYKGVVYKIETKEDVQRLMNTIND